MLCIFYLYCTWRLVAWSMSRILLTSLADWDFGAELREKSSSSPWPPIFTHKLVWNPTLRFTRSRNRKQMKAKSLSPMLNEWFNFKNTESQSTLKGKLEKPPRRKNLDISVVMCVRQKFTWFTIKILPCAHSPLRFFSLVSICCASVPADPTLWPVNILSYYRSTMQVSI